MQSVMCVAGRLPDSASKRMVLEEPLEVGESIGLHGVLPQQVGKREVSNCVFFETSGCDLSSLVAVDPACIREEFNSI